MDEVSVAGMTMENLPALKQKVYDIMEGGLKKYRSSHWRGFKKNHYIFGKDLFLYNTNTNTKRKAELLWIKNGKNSALLTFIKEIIFKARQTAYKSNNSILLNMYWEIG